MGGEVPPVWKEEQAGPATGAAARVGGERGTKTENRRRPELGGR